MYHSSFNYIYLSTDLFTKELNLDKNIPDDAEATKKSIVDFYANRLNDPRLQNSLENIYNLIDFARKFTVKKNQLVLREDPDKTVIITFPKVKIFQYFNKIRFTKSQTS